MKVYSLLEYLKANLMFLKSKWKSQSNIEKSFCYGIFQTASIFPIKILKFQANEIGMGIAKLLSKLEKKINTKIWPR